MNFLHFFLLLGGLYSGTVQAESTENATTLETPQKKSEKPIVEVKDAWMRVTHAGKNAAVFLTLLTPKGAKDVLTGAACAVADHVELHTHKEEKGVMKMRPVEEMVVEETRVLQPGADHIMLMKLNKTLKVGQTIEVTLKFQDSGELNIPVRVRASGGFCAKGTHHHTH